MRGLGGSLCGSIGMTEHHYMTSEEVIDYLQIKLRTLYRLIRISQIPAIRLGRQWRFRKEDIDEWLLKHGRSHGVRAHDLDDGERPRILVVDDDASICATLSKGLSAADYNVDIALDGPAALERIKTENYDLLITDLRMPGMDGLTTIRAAQKHTPNLPIIIVTGASTEASAIEALNLGVIGYLTKPFRMERVLARVARALGGPEAGGDD